MSTEMHFPVKAIALGLRCLKMKVLQGAMELQCAGPGAALQLSGHWHSPLDAPALFATIPRLPWPGKNLAGKNHKILPNPELKSNKCVLWICLLLLKPRGLTFSNLLGNQK